ALRRESRRDLVAHHLDRFGRRTDPRDARVHERAREVGVLGEEPVAGMDGVGARRPYRVEDRGRVQIALRRGLSPQRVGLVGVPDVLRIAVELGVHRNGRDAELAARAHHADRDLTSIRDQDLREQVVSRTPRSSPSGRPRAARILNLMLPAASTWTDARLEPTRFGPVQWFTAVDSTNRVLLDAAARGAAEGAVAVADEQTAGRGRL